MHIIHSFLFFLLLFLSNSSDNFNPKLQNIIIGRNDLKFLEDLTKEVLESSRIRPGEIFSPDFGPNNTGGTIIRPGGRDCYPSFWIRDYAMSLESGLIPLEEQKHMLELTAATQCDQTWITKGGSLIPFGAIADHVRVDDGLPIYFPGTYSYDEQGVPGWGMLPPLSDQFFFIHMAYHFVKESSDINYLLKEFNGVSLLNRLERAFHVPATRAGSYVVHTTENFRAVDFGFRDAIVITGDLCFPSILKYRASNELAWLYEQVNRKQKATKYQEIAKKLKKSIPDLFSDPRGMLKASTGKSQQPDVWSTALAVYLGVLEGDALIKTSQFLADSYQNKTLSYKGNIRHILTSDDFNASSVWEISNVPKNTYQNGAYWSTPTGWVVYSIAITNPDIAKKLADEYIKELRENDFRRGERFSAPYECIQPSGVIQNPVYLTSVTCPYAVFKRILK